MVLFERKLLEEAVNDFQDFIENNEVQESLTLEQYLSFDNAYKLILDIYKNIFFLKDNKYSKILNIGTGWGAFEHLCKINKIDAQTVDLINNEDYSAMNFFREKFGVTVDYNSTDYYYGYVIYECRETFQAVTLSRFYPFQIYVDKYELISFLHVLFDYTDTVIVFDIALSKPFKDTFLELGAEYNGQAYTLTKYDYKGI